MGEKTQTCLLHCEVKPHVVMDIVSDGQVLQRPCTHFLKAHRNRTYKNPLRPPIFFSFSLSNSPQLTGLLWTHSVAPQCVIITLQHCWMSIAFQITNTIPATSTVWVIGSLPFFTHHCAAHLLQTFSPELLTNICSSFLVFSSTFAALARHAGTKWCKEPQTTTDSSPLSRFRFVPGHITSDHFKFDKLSGIIVCMKSMFAFSGILDLPK